MKSRQTRFRLATAGLLIKSLIFRAIPVRVAWICAVMGAAAVGLTGHASADGSNPITRVEEDWQITIGTPDPNLNLPQVTMVMSPTTDATGHHAIFEINQQSQPDYAAGGLQLQRWWSDTCFDFKGSNPQGVMCVNNDVVSFTMSMQVQNGSLTFGVSNGNSQTWGAFGQGQSLNLSTSYDGSDLSSYDPNASLANSYVGFGSNRVQQAVRTAIRYYSNGVLISTDSTQKILWQYTGQ